MDNPINFIDNSFVFLGGSKEYFDGSRTFISMPSKSSIEVSKSNIWGAIRDVYIPISQMASTIKGVQYINNIQPEDCVPFDLETDDKDNFILGYVGEKKFIDAREMVKELSKHKCVYGYNIYRFDNEILYKYASEYFVDVKNANFIAHTLQGVLMIDLMALIRTDVTNESYSAEAIAKKFGFTEEIVSHEEANKDKKCIQDIKINRLIFEKINATKLFNTISTLINCDTTLFQIIKTDRLRKWILINQYLKRGLLPLKKKFIEDVKLQEKPVHFFKKGFYENYKYLDISSTYPQTVKNLYEKGIKLGIYGADDDIFSKFHINMIELAKDSSIKPYIKGLANPTFGSQYSLNEFWRNEDIFNIIVSTVAKKIENIIKKRDDVVYTHTDCFIVPSDSEEIKMEGYDIREKYNFTELYIYNSNKWIGKTKERIEFRGFQNLNSRNPKILKIAREEILENLKKENGEDFKIALDETEKLVSKTLKKIKKFDNSYFKIVVRKNSSYCTDLSLTDIWNKLPMGFSELYYDKNGNPTTNFSKIDFKYYADLIKSLASEYNTEKQDV